MEVCLLAIGGIYVVYQEQLIRQVLLAVAPRAGS